MLGQGSKLSRGFYSDQQSWQDPILNCRTIYRAGPDLSLELVFAFVSVQPRLKIQQ